MVSIELYIQSRLRLEKLDEEIKNMTKRLNLIDKGKWKEICQD